MFRGRLVGLEPTTTGSQTMYSKPAVNPCISDPTKVSRELSYDTIVRIRRTELRTVDRPHHLKEIPASFTSRSPGIATLGPSCTPNRQSDLMFEATNSPQRRYCRDIVPFGTPFQGGDVVPTGSWGMSWTRPAKKRFRQIQKSGELDHSESFVHPLPFTLHRACRGGPAAVALVQKPAGHPRRGGGVE